MSVTDYIIDIVLILVIFRQVRPHQLTTRALLLPLALLGVLQIRRSRAISQPSARQVRIAAVPQHASR